MMTRSPLFVIRRGLVALTAVAQIGIVPALASAQQAAAPQAAAPQARPAGPVLPLSMAQAETMALEWNPQLKSDRLSPAIAEETLAGARSVFNPNLSAAFSRNSSESTSSTAFEGGSTVISSGLQGSTTVRQQLPWYGAGYAVTWNAGRSETSQAFASFNPRLSAGLTLQFSQPLLQGFKTDGQRAGVETALRNRTIADIQLDERTISTRVQVQNAYLDLVGAIARRGVAVQNLELAQRQLRDNMSRVEVGTMAPINIIEAEAEVANREESVLVAESNISSAEDRLRTLILDPSRPDYWTVKIQPTDEITLQPISPNLDEALRNALANRTDLAVARRQLEISDINLEVTKNDTLPVVDLNARYTTSGTGGTQFEYDNSLPTRPLINTVQRGFGSVFGDPFRNNLPAWTVSLDVAYPVGKSGVEANLARQRIQRQQQQVSLDNLVLNITAAVRAAVRDLDTNSQRVKVTETAVLRARRQLDAEEKRFALGLSETFTLQQRQRDLATALISELTAKIDYNRSLIAFEAIQKAPVR
jgi:outer membrane protein